jgi:hypothetical protein
MVASRSVSEGKEAVMKRRSFSSPGQGVFGSDLARIILTAVVFTGFLLIASSALSIPISYGDCILDSISPVGEKDTLTFSGTAGDVIIVRMARMSGNIAVYVEVFDPSWFRIADDWGVAYVGLDTLALTSSGTFAIVASDYTGSGTGPYGLSLQRTFAPGGASSLSYGTTIEDSVTLVTEMNAYTFDAQSGDILTARMGWASGTLLPYMRLFDPSGALIAEDVTYPKPMVDTLALGQTGTYTIIACDEYGPWSGGYGLTLQRTFDPYGADTLVSSSWVQDSITITSELRAYVFLGSAGEEVVIQMTQPASILSPYLELYAPSGQKITEDWGISEAMITEVLASSGWHAILASDYNGLEKGFFDIGITITGISEHGDTGQSREAVALDQNRPNPFSLTTSIHYSLKERGRVGVSVHDVSGRLVRTLVSGQEDAGDHVVLWDGKDDRGFSVASGIYFCVMETDNLSLSRRLVLLK